MEHLRCSYRKLIAVKSRISDFTNIFAFVFFSAIVSSILYNQPGFAAVKQEILPQIKKSDKGFQFDVTSFHSEFNFPTSSRERVVSISPKQIQTRLTKGASDARIEPLQLTVEGKDDRILDLAGKIALPEKKLALANYLKANYVHGEEIPGTNLKLVTLDQTAFNLVDVEAFELLFAKTHKEITLNLKALKKDSRSKAKFLEQIRPFLSSTELENVSHKIALGTSLKIDRDLLPKFARQRVGRHTIYKGPNCFHAALSFQSPLLASSTLVNVNQESGYHREMINYDELWRILQMSFYEVDPKVTDVQYGDMIVFFETKDYQNGVIDYKSLRHAATYLVGGYVFAKGSKSANSPYLVRTLSDEWETWSKYTEKLGAKVFRRSLKSVTSPQPIDPVDWVY